MDSNPDRWHAVDRYLEESLFPADAALQSALSASRAAGLPAIQVSAPQGRLLRLLAEACGARNILEIGTLGGYSTIWLGRALGPDGRLVTLELDAKHAEVARANIANAGLAGRVEVRLGPALESLSRLAAEGAGPFDFAFIDADKPNIPKYFEWVLRLARPGALIVIDNVVRDGALADAASTDPSVLGVRALVEALGANGRVSATVLQTVGVKGYDGFALVRVGPPG